MACTVALSLVLWLLLGAPVRAFGENDDDEDVEHLVSQERRDMARHGLEFFEVTVPLRSGGTTRFALTVMELHDWDADLVLRAPAEHLSPAARRRWHLQRLILANTMEWYIGRIRGGPDAPPLNPEFLTSLRSEEALFHGQNTILILSDVDDYRRVHSLLRIARPGMRSNLLPVHRRFGEALFPLPQPPYRRLPENRIPIYSYRQEEPHHIVMQNAEVYEGDVVELKHYGADPLRRDVDLTGVLFHCGQELGSFSVSRYFSDGSWIPGLPARPALVTPALFVAESDNPSVLAMLRDFQFTGHQLFTNGVRPGQDAEVLYGTARQFGRGFYNRIRNSRRRWQLRRTTMVPRYDPGFLSQLLRENCTAAVASSLQRLHEAAQQLLEDTVARHGRPL